MQNNQFKTPLIQSAAVLAVVIILFIAVGSSGASTTGGGIMALFAGIGNTILFAIGMVISLALSIAILIGVFLGAVAMVDSASAAQMYSDLKKNSAGSALKLFGQCCETTGDGPGVTDEEYDEMKEQITQLQNNNTRLEATIVDITSTNNDLQENLGSLSGENSNLKTQIEELSAAVQELQTSEQQIQTALNELKEKVGNDISKEFQDQISKLENLQEKTQQEVTDLISRFDAVEAVTKQAPTTGIFSYIEAEPERQLFIKKVEEAVLQGMTYAQINDYLTENLPQELDTILKDHPSLTKKYVKSKRN